MVDFERFSLYSFYKIKKMKQTACLILLVFLLASGFASYAQVDTSCVQVSFTLTPGFYPNEISYSVVNMETNTEVAAGTGVTLSGVWCLPVGCYAVNMFDTFGDGWNGGNLQIFVMGESTYSGTMAVGNSGSFLFGVGVGATCGTSATEGCMDATASNFNPLATINTGCLYEGCTDPAAVNFSTAANTDNGSCLYCNGPGSVNAQLYICTYDNGNQVDLTILNSSGDTVFISPVLGNVAVYYVDLCLQEGECYTAILSNNAGLPSWYNGYFWINNGQSQVIHYGLPGNLTTQSVLFSMDGTCEDVFGCTNPLAVNYNPAATIDNGTCYLIQGCMDPTAANYNPDAVVDDGSCYAGCDNGTTVTVSFNPGMFGNEASYNIVNANGTVLLAVSNPNSNTINNAQVCLQDGCYTLNMFDSFGDGWDGGVNSGIALSANGDYFVISDMTSGSMQSMQFGINSDCIIDTLSCTTSISLIPDSLVEMANSVQLFWNEDLSAISGVTWDFGNGATSNELFPTYFYESIGTYTVCLNVNYVSGCSASNCLTFTMDANDVSGPGGAQTNGFWLNTSAVYPNAVAEITSVYSSVNIFPNPTSGSIAAKASQLTPSENTIIRIYSIDGKEVFANNFGNGAINNTFQLNVSELSNGYYFLSIQNGNQMKRVPFVKE